MSLDVSGFNTKIWLIASVTFPQGFGVSQFTNDADPLDFASIKIGDAVMGVNGDLITWARAVSLPMVLNVIPGGIDDINLGILAEANRVGQGKSSALDVITATAIYPDGSSIILQSGKILDAMFGKSISSESRLKTKSYAFAFGNKVGF